MKALSRMPSATIHGGLLSGFFVGSRHSSLVDISHLLFVDDNLPFCGAKPYVCFNFILIRKGWENFSSYSRFEVGDGFRINFWHN
jgi:hypothetical protein